MIAIAQRRHTRTQEQGGLAKCDFELLVRNYSGRLVSVAERLLGCEQDAAEAVQDAFLSAFASRHTFHGHSTVYTWLYRIVVNACLMKIRSRPRAKTVSLDELLPTFDDAARPSGPVEWRPRAANDPEREESRAVVRACIDELPDSYRTIVWLRDIEQFDTQETARRLGLSPGAVKTRLHRARQALRTLLEPVFADSSTLHV